MGARLVSGDGVLPRDEAATAPWWRRAGHTSCFAARQPQGWMPRIRHWRNAWWRRTASYGRASATGATPNRLHRGHRHPWKRRWDSLSIAMRVPTSVPKRVCKQQHRIDRSGMPASWCSSEGCCAGAAGPPCGRATHTGSGTATRAPSESDEIVWASLQEFSTLGIQDARSSCARQRRSTENRAGRGAQNIACRAIEGGGGYMSHNVQRGGTMR